MTTISAPADAVDRAWVDIDLGAVVTNARRVAHVAGARLMPMVKANGYGLGAVAVARALEPLEPWGYGVASVEEGAELRAAGIGRPILLVTPPLVSWMPQIRRHALRPALGDLESLRAWITQAPDEPFHVALDTGMSRAGFPVGDRGLLHAVRDTLHGQPGYEGAFTHFHSADTDPGSTADSWQAFQAAVDGLGPRPPLLHAANSAAAMAGAAYAADLVRPGIYLYGGRAGSHVPQPVASLRSTVVSVRRLAPGASVSYGATWTATAAVTVATVAIGYADGLPRAFAGRGVMRIGECVAPVRGRVTMDMTVVEVDESVRIGDEALVFGEGLPIDEQAERAGTISYELLTSLGRRVARRYRAP